MTVGRVMVASGFCHLYYNQFARRVSHTFYTLHSFSHSQPRQRMFGAAELGGLLTTAGPGAGAQQAACSIVKCEDEHMRRMGDRGYTAKLCVVLDMNITPLEGHTSV